MIDSLSLIQLILIIAIIFINVFTFILYYIDKQRAVKRKYRISEKTLMLSAFSLGGIGAWLGMSKFRHKTNNSSFKVGVPIAALFTAAVVYIILNFKI